MGGQDEQQREADAKALEATRYQREMEVAQKEAVAEKQRRRAGFVQEQVEQLMPAAANQALLS